jgi:hypothetical protein
MWWPHGRSRLRGYRDHLWTICGHCEVVEGLLTRDTVRCTLRLGACQRGVLRRYLVVGDKSEGPCLVPPDAGRFSPKVML